MLKIDFKEKMNVTDSSGRGFKKSKEFHEIIPEGNIKKMIKNFLESSNSSKE